MAYNGIMISCKSIIFAISWRIVKQLEWFEFRSFGLYLGRDGRILWYGIITKITFSSKSKIFTRCDICWQICTVFIFWTKIGRNGLELEEENEFLLCNWSYCRSLCPRNYVGPIFHTSSRGHTSNFRTIIASQSCVTMTWTGSTIRIPGGGF